MRRESASEREAWTALVEGRAATKPHKYGAKRSGKYPSKHEANEAAKLHALAVAGKIRNLREQHPITLVPGDGKLRPIIFVADFTFDDDDGFHVLDAKGFKTPVYRLKKRLAALLLGIKIEEV